MEGLQRWWNGTAGSARREGGGNGTRKNREISAAALSSLCLENGGSDDLRSVSSTYYIFLVPPSRNKVHFISDLLIHFLLCYFLYNGKFYITETEEWS